MNTKKSYRTIRHSFDDFHNAAITNFEKKQESCE